MKAAELKTLTVEELNAKLKELKTELFNHWLNCRPPANAIWRPPVLRDPVPFCPAVAEVGVSGSLTIRCCFLMELEVGARIRNVFA